MAASHEINSMAKYGTNSDISAAFAGPGPVPSLDGQNVVFGTVLEGYNTVTAIASQPTFKPNERIQAVNQLASLIGDERAARVRAKYGKPLKSVVITDVGVLPIREPFPRPV